MKPKKGLKRGFPIAVLIGLEKSHANIWKIYSKTTKHEKTIAFADKKSTPQSIYNFHENLINALRPTLNEGIKSIILAAPAKTNYAKHFIKHIKTHHAWLTQEPNKVAIREITGLADTPQCVTSITKSTTFQNALNNATEEENQTLIELLEKHLNTTNQNTQVLYSLKEIEDTILTLWKTNKTKPEILLLTDTYLASAREKNRLNRLMQIAANKNIQTRILTAKSTAGKRITQLGGITLLAKTT